MFYSSMESLVGNTPMLALNNVVNEFSLRANIFAKLEFFNPAGSVKDRVALKMILDARENGRLKNGATIIEPTSGNTGIGLAALGVSMGYRVIIVMPDTMSAERIQIIKAYGAEIVLTDGKKGMTGAIEKANELCKAIPDAMIMGQFENPSNPIAHYCTTGPEIWKDTDGTVDILVSAVGTGGTISGTGAFLKEKNPNIKIIAVEPASSPVLSGGNAGPHKIQGIGAGFIPEVLNSNIIDGIVKVSDDEAYEYGRKLAQLEGLLVGISSGAALSAAIKISALEENRNKNIVVIFPDTGSRYLSTQNYF